MRRLFFPLFLKSRSQDIQDTKWESTRYVGHHQDVPGSLAQEPSGHRYDIPHPLRVTPVTDSGEA